MASEEEIRARCSSCMVLTTVKDQKGNQKTDARMGYVKDEKRTTAVKSVWAFLVGYTSLKFKPRNNHDLGLSGMAQSGKAQSGMAQGKIRAY